MTLRNWMIASVVSLVMGLGAAKADVVTYSQWAAVYDDGGLGGSFAFLNSDGASPFGLGTWETQWSPTDVVYSATFGGGQSYGNFASWDGSSFIYSFGYPDTTSYGEVFFAPSSSLESFNFLINTDGSGDQANFIVAGWDSTTSSPISSLYSQAITLSGGGYQWTNIDGLDVPLTAGNEYIAFLTVSNVSAVPENSTWALLLTGFVALGFLARRATRKRYAAYAAA